MSTWQHIGSSSALAGAEESQATPPAAVLPGPCSVEGCPGHGRQRPPLRRLVERDTSFWERMYGGRAVREIARAQGQDDPGAGFLCETCRGIGWVRRDLPVEDPEFGKSVRCPTCWTTTAIHVATPDERAAEMGFGPRERAQTFAAFVERLGTEKALAAARAFAAQPAGWLVIHGEVGSGKSHLSRAVTNALLDAGERVAWWYAPDLADEYMRRVEDHTNGTFLDSVKQAPILILDDLGAVAINDFVVKGCLEPLINYRERKPLPTLITCIGSPSEIKVGYSPSIGRRMQDQSLCVVAPITAGQYGQEAVAA